MTLAPVSVCLQGRGWSGPTPSARGVLLAAAAAAAAAGAVLEKVVEPIHQRLAAGAAAARSASDLDGHLAALPHAYLVRLADCNLLAGSNRHAFAHLVRHLDGDRRRDHLADLVWDLLVAHLLSHRAGGDRHALLDGVRHHLAGRDRDLLHTLFLHGLPGGDRNLLLASFLDHPAG